MSINHLLAFNNQYSGIMNPEFNSLKVRNNLEVDGNVIIDGSVEVDNLIIKQDEILDRPDAVLIEGDTLVSQQLKIGYNTALNYGSIFAENVGVPQLLKLNSSLAGSGQCEMEQLNTNIISSKNINGNLLLDPNGTGKVLCDAELDSDIIKSKTNNVNLQLGAQGSGLVQFDKDLCYSGASLNILKNTGANTQINILGGNNNSLSVNSLDSTTNWVAISAGQFGSKRVVMGNFANLANTPTIGGHNGALNAWDNLSINPGVANIYMGLYQSANKVCIDGDCDIVLGSSYKINNIALLNSNNIFIYNGAFNNNLTSSATANRSNILPDKNGTFAMISDIPNQFLNFGGTLTTITNVVYQTAIEFIFPGTNEFPIINNIYVLADFTAAVANGDLRISDVTNATVICELFNLTTAGIFNMGVIANLPLARAHFAVQTRSPAGSVNIDQVQFSSV
jgi:hypothetical protein